MESTSVHVFNVAIYQLRTIVLRYSCGYGTYTVCGDPPTVGIHAGHEVDPGAVHEGLDLLVAGEVLDAEVLGQVEEELPAQDLVAVHVGNELHLRLH